MYFLSTGFLNDYPRSIQTATNYLKYINSKFRQYFIPEKAISVDESVVKFKGRISHTNQINQPNRIYTYMH